MTSPLCVSGGFGGYAFGLGFGGGFGGDAFGLGFGGGFGGDACGLSCGNGFCSNAFGLGCSSGFSSDSITDSLSDIVRRSVGHPPQYELLRRSVESLHV